jgi:hypothetical protein
VPRPKNEPNPDELAITVKKLLDNRLKSGSPLTVFDSYVYEVKSYVPKDQSDASGSGRKESDVYRNLEETDIQEDRRSRNPLAVDGFWAVPWQARLKILRQLVDWTCKCNLVWKGSKLTSFPLSDDERTGS